ncbi:MAG: glutamyl-tRNA reductase, partial [Rhodothermales bacterium]
HRGQALDALSALVVGSGSMGLIAAEALCLERIRSLSFTNRSEERGRAASSKYHATFVPWSDRYQAAAAADVVIVATSAEEPVLFFEPFRDAGVSDGLLIIDISVPRNVERGIEELPGIHVINVDQLIEVAEGTQEVRASAVPDARRIVDEMLGEFVSWVFHHQALQPAIRAIGETFEAIRVQEVNRHHQRFSEADRAELDRITRSIIQKLLAVPIVRLKSVDPESINFAHGIRLLHALFERQECEDDRVGTSSDAPPLDSRSEALREDCPIEPQLPGAPFADEELEMDLRDILRSFPGRDEGTTAS